MMRFTSLGILLALVALPSIGRAQNCWSPVTSWQGTYQLTGTGSGADCLGSGLSWTVGTNAQANLNMPKNVISCSEAVWGGPDSIASGSVNFFGTQPCIGAPPSTETYAASGGPTLPTAGSITIDESAQTYHFLDELVISGTFTDVNCGVQDQHEPFILTPWPTNA